MTGGQERFGRCRCQGSGGSGALNSTMVMQGTGTGTAKQVMTKVESLPGGLSVSFADGLVSLVPWDNIKEIHAQSDLLSLEISTPYELTIRTREGRVVEIPWDFVRCFGDPEYRQRDAELAARGLDIFARRLRSFRCKSRLSQGELAKRSGLEEAIIEQMESGVRDPNLVAIRKLAAALGRPVQELMMDDRFESESKEARQLSPEHPARRTDQPR